MSNDGLAQVLSALIGSLTSIALALIVRQRRDRPRRRRRERRRPPDDFTDDPDAF